MNRKDLIAGKHLVVLRDKTMGIVMDGWIQNITEDGKNFNGWLGMDNYKENMTVENFPEWDITKVFKIQSGFFNGIVSFNGHCELVWEEDTSELAKLKNKKEKILEQLKAIEEDMKSYNR